MSSTDAGTRPLAAAPLALTCVGLSHRTTPIEVREAVALSAEESSEAVRQLTAGRANEALVLSTCNRTEFYVQGTTPDESRRLVREVMLAMKQFDLSNLDGALYLRTEPDAARHLFRVACGLDSMVLGEPEILGQVRQSAELASRAGGTKLVVGKLTELAFASAKRARTETSIGVGAVSFASASVEVARKVFGTLTGRRILVVGAGEAARLAAEAIRAAGATDFVVANRGEERGRTLAAAICGRAVPIAAVANELAWADLVLTATSSPGPLIQPAAARDAVRRRGGRQIVFIDLAVPRDVDPLVNGVPNVFVHDLDALRSVIETNLDRRRREVPRVEAIVEDGVERFLRWHRGLAVTPTLTQFRERIEAIRAAEVERHRHQLRGADLEAVESITRAIVNKILHTPTTRLREAPGDLLGGSRVDALRHLFDLDGDAADGRAGRRERPESADPGGKGGA